MPCVLGTLEANCGGTIRDPPQQSCELFCPFVDRLYLLSEPLHYLIGCRAKGQGYVLFLVKTPPRTINRIAAIRTTKALLQEPTPAQAQNEELVQLTVMKVLYLSAYDVTIVVSCVWWLQTNKACLALPCAP